MSYFLHHDYSFVVYLVFPVVESESDLIDEKGSKIFVNFKLSNLTVTILESCILLIIKIENY